MKLPLIDQRPRSKRLATKIFGRFFPGFVVAIVAGCAAMGVRDTSYHPQIDPANFQATVDNPYYPLVPGTTLTYLETSRGEKKENKITVTHDTKTIMGVKCVVVHDTVTKNGRLLEDTWDWLAQDKEGAVWYFGEATREISPGGQVSTQGSWEAGVKGGQPGVLMPAYPAPGTPPYRQEYGPGAAEDMGQIIALNQSVTVPAGTFADCVKTREWSLLEGGHENKWYARGVGVVKETSTGGDVIVLISITHE
jgi:hypothetical protein